MPLINRPCDVCGKKDNPVYEQYKVQTGNTIKLRRHELIPNRFVPADMEYWCKNCSERGMKILAALQEIF